MKEEEVKSLFTLAGFEVKQQWELANSYWPRHPDYYAIIMDNPAWLIQTKYGLIRLSPRKRVWELDWSDTAWRGVITQDDVTKTDTLVHAWNVPALLTYLQTLHRMLDRDPS